MTRARHGHAEDDVQASVHGQNNNKWNQTCTKCISSVPTPDQRLHEQGFAIYRKAFKLDDDTIDIIRESRYLPIFNGLDGDKVTYDGKRVMAGGEWRPHFGLS